MGKNKLIKYILGFQLLITFSVSTINAQTTNAQIGFIENKGQIVDQNYQVNTDVKYLLSIPQMNIQLKENGFSYDTYIQIDESKPAKFSHEELITKIKNKEKITTNDESEFIDDVLETHFSRVDIVFLNTATNSYFEEIDVLDGYSNFYTDYSAPEGIKNVRKFRVIKQKNIYNGIDIEYIIDNKSNAFKYNFIIHPGADLTQIKWKYNGVEASLSEDKKSINFEVYYPSLNKSNKLSEHIPYSFLVEDKQEINVKYKNEGAVFSFFTENYSSTKTLIIDPAPQVEWSTYYGGNMFEGEPVADLTSDLTGNIYMIGFSSSILNIATVGSFNSSLNGMSDAYFVKFDSNGNRIWSTYYGGTGVDIGHSITSDNAGFIYVAGETNSTAVFGTVGCHQLNLAGGNDAFISKFDVNGNRIWSTYYGGTGNDAYWTGYSYGFFATVRYAPNGAIYFSSSTNSTTGISTPGTYQTSLNGASYDAYIVKFDLNGNRQFATYFGGSEDDYNCEVSVDLTGKIAIVGGTFSLDLPILNAYQPVNQSGGWERTGFVTTLNSTASSLIWSTFLGGSGLDHTTSCQFDLNNNLIIGTFTVGSNDFPVTPGCFQPTFSGSCCGVVGKFLSTGVPAWITFYGGSDEDHGFDASVDNSGVIFFSGETSSPSMLATPCSHQENYAGNFDAYLAKINTLGDRIWGTYFGGSDYDKGFRNLPDNIDKIYLSGLTYSTNGIATSGSHQATLGGNLDHFLTKFYDCDAPEIPIISNDTNICLGETISLNVISGNLNDASDWNWYTGTCGGTLVGTGTSISVTPSVTTTYFVKAEGACASCRCDTVTVIVNPMPTFSSVSNSNSLLTCLSPNSTLNATATATSILWNGGSLMNAANPATVTVGGSYTVTALNPLTGCSVDSTIQVVANTTLPVISSTTNSGDITCTNLSSTLTATSAGNNMVWNGGSLVNAINPANVSSAGTYTVTATNPTNGCTATSTTTVLLDNLSPTLSGVGNSGAITCLNPSSTLSATSAGNTLVWNGGSLVNAPNPANTSANGTYTVTATNPTNGCTTSGTTTVLLNTTLPTLTGVGNSGAISCLNPTSSLSATSAGNTLVWNGGSLVNAPNPATTSQGGTFTVTATDPTNGCTATATTTVTLDTLSPVISMINNSGSITCTTTTSTLSATSAGNTLVWNGGSLVNTANPATVSQGGTYTVTVSNPSNGCTSLASTTVLMDTVSPLANAGIDQSLCEGIAVTLTANTGGNPNFVWDNDVVNGVPFTQGVGTITYTLTVTNSANGCVNEDQVTVIVNPTPQVLFDGNVLSGCAPLSVSFTNLSPLLGDNCVWNFGDGTIAMGCGNANHVYSIAGQYDVSLTLTANGCTSSDTLFNYILVEEQANASFTFDATNLSSENTQVHFNNQSTNASSYVWTFGDGTGSSTLENPTHVFPETTNSSYTVTLIAQNASGCMDSVQQIVHIPDVLIYYVPNSFTPDGDEFNNVFVPVFTSGYDPSDYHMSIYNRWGELLFESHNVEMGWDGTYLDKGLVQDGIYVWVIEFQESMTDKRHRVEGHVNVLK